LHRAAVLLLAVLLSLLPFHPFLSTALGSAFPEGAFLIGAWKELLLVMLIGLIAVLALRQGHWRRFDGLDLTIILFTLVALLSGIFFTGNGFPENLPQLVWGAKYGLMFLIAFFFVRRLRLAETDRRILWRAAMIPAVAVVLFGLLQIFVLPEDTLVRFGYNPQYGITEVGKGISYCHKIENRITHQEFCRTQSTLSGPNELGAYLLLILPLFAFALTQARPGSWRFLARALLLLGAVIVLFFTWSRSAWIGTIAAVAASFVIQAARPRYALLLIGLLGAGIAAVFFPVLFLERWDELKPLALAGGSAALVAMLGLLTLNLKRGYFSMAGGAVFPLALAGLLIMRARFDTFFWNIILRPSSSQGHWERWSDGAYYIMASPLGLGLGDAGPASARFARPGETGFLPESWYLQVGLEAGVAGLILFVTVLLLLALALLRSADPYGKPLLLSLVGISSAALFLHSWESAAVSLSFWILAGLALAPPPATGIMQLKQRFLSFFRQ
jgi:hypothetical protein